ncbi:MAG: winged helix-turn-helix transcriptional regulator [Candidatus Heimdallarchaeota archaeon]
MNVQDKLALESERKLLEALMQKSPQTWSELVKNTGLSTRTLQKALKRLMSQQKIYRQVEPTEKYPPPVLYGLTPEGEKSLLPIVFQIKSSFYTLGFIPRYEKAEIKGEKEEVTIKFPLEDELKGASIQKCLQIVCRRFFATALFNLLQYLETGDPLWKEQIPDGILTSHFLARFGLTDYAEMKTAPIGGYSEDLILKVTNETILIDKERLKVFENAIKQTFPEEYKQLQQIYNECVKSGE